MSLVHGMFGFISEATITWMTSTIAKMTIVAVFIALLFWEYVVCCSRPPSLAYMKAVSQQIEDSLWMSAEQMKRHRAQCRIA